MNSRSHAVVSALIVAAILILTASTLARAQTPAAAAPETTSLLGVPLYPIQFSPEATKTNDERIRQAREALAKAPGNADAKTTPVLSRSGSGSDHRSGSRPPVEVAR